MYQEYLVAAIQAGCESETIEFKASFDPSSASEWIELIKDIVALANSGGAVLIVGVSDNGSRNGFDCASLVALDPAHLTDKLHKYTGQQFHGFRLEWLAMDTHTLFAIVISAVAVPIVFSRPGTYDVGGGKQRTAFSQGTVYFRHGAKSEPGTSDDLRYFLERRLEEIRRSWLDGIAKVVEAPAGAQVQNCGTRIGK